MLAERFVNNMLPGRLGEPGTYRPFPAASDRAFWDSLPDDFTAEVSSRALSAKQEPWPALPASLFLSYVRTGERNSYQQARTRRRQRLATLALAECCENRGEFLDDTIDALWAICEETSWIMPAHNFMYEANAQHNRDHLPLPDAEEPVVDLGAVETAAELALVSYLLASEFDEVTPLIRRRVQREITTRIIEPFLERDDFWWMGFMHFENTTINNWNPWCVSRTLQAAWLVCEDKRTLNRTTAKAMRILDLFIGSYPEDGACDEGPGYWNVAAGALFDALELLSSVSDNAVAVWDEPLIGRMAAFITTLHIDGDYYVNFADAKPIVKPDPALLYRMGKRTGNSTLLAMSYMVYGRHGKLQRALDGSMSFHRALELLLVHNEIEQIDEPPFRAPAESWHEQLQIMTARDDTTGLHVAVKGGHNNESHNHNDVGTFTVYAQGKPIIIDVGVGTYTGKTFNPNLRYTIWTMQSQFHNLPVVDGFGQNPGEAFLCDEALFESTRNRTQVELSIGNAWPEAAGIASWKRRVALNRSGVAGIEVTDTYALSHGGADVSWHFLLAHKPRIETGMVLLSSADGPVLTLHADGQTTWSVERIEVEDDALLASWGPAIFRLVGKEAVRDEGKKRFTIEPITNRRRRAQGDAI